MEEPIGLILKGSTALFLRGTDPGPAAAALIIGRYRLGDHDVASEHGLELVSRPGDLAVLSWKYGFFTIFERKLRLPEGPFDPELMAVVKNMEREEAANGQAPLKPEKALGRASAEARMLLRRLADGGKLYIEAGVWRLEKSGGEGGSIICPGGITTIEELRGLGYVDALNSLTVDGRAATEPAELTE